MINHTEKNLSGNNSVSGIIWTWKCKNQILKIKIKEIYLYDKTPSIILIFYF